MTAGMDVSVLRAKRITHHPIWQIDVWIHLGHEAHGETFYLKESSAQDTFTWALGTTPTPAEQLPEKACDLMRAGRLEEAIAYMDAHTQAVWTQARADIYRAMWKTSQATLSSLKKEMYQALANNKT